MDKHFDVKKSLLNDFIFEPKKRYEIPRYQRPYSWFKEKILEFLQLLNQEEVFIGTVIFNIEREKKENIVELIDGQQRFLTIGILAAAIRDLCLEEFVFSSDKSFLEYAEDIQYSMLQKKNRFSDKSVTYFVIPGETTADYYEKNIQMYDKEFVDSEYDLISKSTPSTNEETLVFEAYDIFKSHINEILEGKTIPEKFSSIDKMLKNLKSHFIVSIEIKDDSLAYEIFESVNEMGVSLSVEDLIKNQIFKHIKGDDKRNKDIAKEQWLKMISNLQGCSYTSKEFLRYYWASKYQYLSDKVLYKGIKKEFKNNSNLWGSFLIDIEKNSAILNNIYSWGKEDIIKFQGNRRNGLKFYKCLRVLKLTNAKTWVILMMSIIRNWDKINELEVKFDKHWDKIAKFSFLYHHILGLPGNWYFKIVHKYSQEIENAKTKEDFNKLFRSLYGDFKSKLNISKEEFRINFEKLEYKNDTRIRSIINYVFGEIEYNLRDNDEGYDEDKISIEHFLPQEPANWKLTKRETRDHINKIGNLVLIPTSLNGKLGNIACEEKVKVIETSDVKMKQLDLLVQNIKNKTWDFMNISKHNFNPIIERQNEITILAYEIWVINLKKQLGS